MARRLHRPRLNEALDHQKSQGFTDIGLLRTSESVRVHAYSVLSSQASASSHITGNMQVHPLPRKPF